MNVINLNTFYVEHKISCSDAVWEKNHLEVNRNDFCGVLK